MTKSFVVVVKSVLIWSFVGFLVGLSLPILLLLMNQWVGSSPLIHEQPWLHFLSFPIEIYIIFRLRRTGKVAAIAFGIGAVGVSAIIALVVQFVQDFDIN